MAAMTRRCRALCVDDISNYLSKLSTRQQSHYTQRQRRNTNTASQTLFYVKSIILKCIIYKCVLFTLLQDSKGNVFLENCFSPSKMCDTYDIFFLVPLLIL